MSYGKLLHLDILALLLPTLFVDLVPGHALEKDEQNPGHCSQSPTLPSLIVLTPFLLGGFEHDANILLDGFEHYNTNTGWVFSLVPPKKF